MSSKVLFCATVDYHFEMFHLPVLRWFQEQGWEVHVAACGTKKLPYTDKKFNLPFQRSPFKWRNIQAYRQLKRLMEEHHYEVVHCHTPVGGVLSRLAARSFRRKGTKVLYTAHGFHFYRGAPWRNWLIYYPVEKIMSAFTDCLITINKEDHRLANERKFHASSIVHIHGVGVDPVQFKPLRPHFRAFLRAEYGFSENDLLIVYVGEFNANKNQQLLIRAFAAARQALPEAKLLLVGKGPLLDPCRQLAKSLKVDDAVLFLGYRKDVQWLMPMCDIAASTSLREGLPVNILEAMAAGLPVLATKNRGHNELIQHQKGGFVCHSNDLPSLVDALQSLCASARLRHEMGQYNLVRAKRYHLSNVLSELIPLYEQITGKKKQYLKARSGQSDPNSSATGRHDYEQGRSGDDVDELLSSYGP